MFNVTNAVDKLEWQPTLVENDSCPLQVDKLVPFGDIGQQRFISCQYNIAGGYCGQLMSVRTNVQQITDSSGFYVARMNC